MSAYLDVSVKKCKFSSYLVNANKRALKLSVKPINYTQSDFYDNGCENEILHNVNIAFFIVLSKRP